MTSREHHIAEDLIGAQYEAMDAHTQRVAKQLTKRGHISRHPDQKKNGQSDFGQRAADAVARFGGSWTFIFAFLFFLLKFLLIANVCLSLILFIYSFFYYYLLCSSHIDL